MAVDDGYTKVLMHFDGADGGTTFTDESGKTWARNSNGAELDTAQKVFGTASLLLPYGATQDYIYTAHSSDFDFGTNDFTIDCRIRFNSSAWYDNSVHHIIGDGYNTGFTCQYYHETTTKRIRIWTANVSNDFSWTPSGSTWYHFAVSRSGTNLRVFIDGSQIGTTKTDSSNIGGTGQLRIGDDPSASTPTFGGWIDEMRLSKGIARWTANFTPPTAPYGGWRTRVIFIN